ncbi:MAG: type III-B CRISPR module RAMP protein Cmr4 [Alphaproteobacteria bacterium]|nr:type III-B CRISPR module RAMP protein Cmr4 [Alphaproteobacteria bacterium]
MSSTRLLVVHARSPLHAGTGQSTAAVDLPIARDRATGLPLLPGSSIKGALRARGRSDRPSEVVRVFGPETMNASDHAGSVAFSDARLLLLPVRSVAGTFAWVTSPYLVASFARDAGLVGLKTAAIPPVPDESCCQTARDSLLVTQVTGRKVVVLEEFDLRVEPGLATKLAEDLAAIVFPGDSAWQDLFRKRFCLVHDDVMSFLGQHATEIVTRVSIDPETGTAKPGQLWTEENLPAESVLVGIVEEVPTGRWEGRQGAALEVVRALAARPIQLGGKATVGRGRCQIHLSGGSEA